MTRKKMIVNTAICFITLLTTKISHGKEELGKIYKQLLNHNKRIVYLEEHLTVENLRVVGKRGIYR